MAKNTCRDCNRTVLLVSVGGGTLAVDPELITVVPAQQSQRGGSELPSVRMSTRQTYARRVHAERCQDYQEAARRERLRDEMRAFTDKQQGRAVRAPRRNRGL